MIVVLTGTAPALTHYVVRGATRDIVYDSEIAQEMFGWKPAVDLDDGLYMTQGRAA